MVKETKSVKGADEIYCSSCGEIIKSAAEVCPKCGVRQRGVMASNKKSRMSAALLALFLGGLGAHKFYLGRWKMGVLYLLCCWTCIPVLLAFIEGLKHLFESDGEFDAVYNQGA